MLVAIDAVGIRMGGGAALLTEFLWWLPEVRPKWKWLVFLLPRHAREFDDPPARNRVKIQSVSIGGSYPGRLWWLYRELPGRLDRTGADVLFAFANVGSSRCPAPQVVYIHQSLPFLARQRRRLPAPVEVKMDLLRTLILRGALRSRSVIVQTEDMRSRLRFTAPELGGRLQVVPGCVSRIGPGEEIRPDKRQLIDKCVSPVLVYIAHPAEHKNHVNLIRALPRIVNTYPNTTLVLNIDPDEPNAMVDATWVCEIRRLAYDLGLTGHVVWLGVLSAPEVRYLLRHATVASFPSLDESFGLPLAEAITEGCPLAASDRPFARDVAGGAAVYFDPLDPDSIAECITSLIGSPERLEHLRMEARVRQTRFQPRHVAEQIAASLEAAAQPTSVDRAQLRKAVC